MKDLGVIFDNELNFVQHCKEKINTAYSYLKIIKRNFIYLDEDAFFYYYNYYKCQDYSDTIAKKCCRGTVQNVVSKFATVNDVQQTDSAIMSGLQRMP